MSGARKRSHSEYEADETSSHNVGVAATLSAIKHDAEDAPSGVNGHPEKAKNDDGEGWQVASGRKTKNKRHKQNQKQRNDKGGNYPAISYSSNARLQSQVRITELQMLVLYLLSDGPSPQWCSVAHRANFKKVVVLMVPGLEKCMFDGSMSLDKLASRDAETSDGSLKEMSKNLASPDDYYPQRLVEDDLPLPLKPMAKMFSHIWPIKTPGDDKMHKMHSPLQSMLIAPIPKDDKEKLKKSGPGPPRGSKTWTDEPTSITTFLAKTDQLHENDEYVLHPEMLPTAEAREEEEARRKEAGQTSENGWVDTKAQALDASLRPLTKDKDNKHDFLAGAKAIAIDCEMVLTGSSEFALARVSCVDWNGEIILDELCKPQKPITDYLTPYSGMTAAKLDPVTTTLTDIQARLLGLLDSDTILIGHSINSDLNALQLTHPNFVDTSIIYPHPRGPPLKSSLKWLAQKYLGKDIQKGQNGHNSIEDARTALELVKQKCERGKNWGTTDASNESIMKRIGRSPKPGLRSSSSAANGASAAGADVMRDKGTHCTTALIDWGVPSRSYGAAADVCIGCSSDEEVITGVKRAVAGDTGSTDVPAGGVEFVWARMRSLEAARGWWTSSKQKDVEQLREQAKAGGATTAGAAEAILVPLTGAPIAGPADKISVPLVGIDTVLVGIAAAEDEKIVIAPSTPSEVAGALPMDTTKPDHDLTTTSAPADLAHHPPDLPPATTTTINPPNLTPAAAADPATTTTPSTTSSLTTTITSTISHISQIHASLPPHTALIIYSGTGDTREFSRLTALQAQFKKEYATKKWDEVSVKWSDKEERALVMELRRARQGVGFVCVK